LHGPLSPAERTRYFSTSRIDQKIWQPILHRHEPGKFMMACRLLVSLVAQHAACIAPAKTVLA